MKESIIIEKEIVKIGKRKKECVVNIVESDEKGIVEDGIDKNDIEIEIEEKCKKMLRRMEMKIRRRRKKKKKL